MLHYLSPRFVELLPLNSILKVFIQNSSYTFKRLVYLTTEFRNSSSACLPIGAIFDDCIGVLLNVCDSLELCVCVSVCVYVCVHVRFLIIRVLMRFLCVKYVCA